MIKKLSEQNELTLLSQINIHYLHTKFSLSPSPSLAHAHAHLEIQKLLMSGVGVHLESTLSDQRHIGMAVSESVFNRLNPVDQEHRLKFEYETNDEITALRLLARPVLEQEADLKEWRERNRIVVNDKLSQEEQQQRKVGVARGVIRQEREADRFGEGMVEATECSDTDRSENNYWSLL